MAVTDQDILDVITDLQKTLTGISNAQAESATAQTELAADVTKAIAEIEALPSGTIQDGTLASLKSAAASLATNATTSQTQADALKATADGLDAIVNPPVVDAPVDDPAPDASQQPST